MKKPRLKTKSSDLYNLFAFIQTTSQIGNRSSFQNHSLEFLDRNQLIDTEDTDGCQRGGAWGLGEKVEGIEKCTLVVTK